ncbi:MAG TPA: CoA transferase [Stellaceae bacterium]|jgi:crotonobetainyl-CoA:carnitine CoA-transferase CaiB-like acyl-CoA transferase|nr:CoA transferase [Stellaceae bacterium]
MSKTAPSPKPLQGIRVLDLSSFISGPFCTTQLAEFGAEVIKIELPKVGDAFRRFGTPSKSGDSLIFMSEQRNKKSITLDLRTPEGAELAKQLAANVDIVVENFQVGTLEGWGIGYDELRKHNPRLIMVRITGYGQTGPYRDRPGFGRIANAFSGLSFLAGYPDRAPVTPGSATIPDYLTGIYGAYGALLALRARDITGEGQMIDIGLYEPVFRILDELASAYHETGRVRQRMGPATVNAVPHSHYPTKDGRWVAIACTTDKIFERLAAAMGRPEIAGGGPYGTFKQRTAARDAVDALVSDWTRGLGRDDVLETCAAYQVPCGPVYAIDEIFDDPQYKARENILILEDERAGEIAVPNVVPRLSETPGAIEWLGSPLGAHNREVFGELLGLSDERIAELSEKGVI